VRLLGRSREPAVVFTEFRHSLDVLTRRLSAVRRIAVMHGSQTAVDRAAALDAFLGGEAGVLVATDVAGQGLNLQHRARWVVNLELPWNPARLEQRAGRVDRIGQQRPVHVTLLVADHAAESGLLARLARRAFAATRALGSGGRGIASVDAVAVREAVLTSGVEPPDDVEPRIAVCKRWRRHAQWIAHDLVWRRLLRARSPEVARRIPWTPAGLVPALRGLGGSLLIFDVPILDGTGNVVEHRVVALRVAPGLPDDDVIVAARRVAAQAVAPRVARLERVFRRWIQPAIARELHLREHLLHLAGGGEVQHGLFDGRAIAHAAAAYDARATIESDAITRVKTLRSAGGLRCGSPTLVSVFAGGRS
jgi:hypothetical protein